MYFRYLIEKGNNKSGFFHSLPEWGVPKEDGMYDIVPRYFESLPYHKLFKENSISWFTEYGNNFYQYGIKALRNFYSKFGVHVICVASDNPGNIAVQDDYQVCCCIDQV